MCIVFLLVFLFSLSYCASDTSILNTSKQLILNKEFENASILLMQEIKKEHTQEEKLEIGNSLLNIGNIFFSRGHINKAFEVYEQLYSTFPFSSTILYSLSLCAHELAQYKKARELLVKARIINPDDIEVQKMLAIIELALGNYEQGWQLYESRWQQPDRLGFKMPCPRWDGKASLKDKKIVLLNEGALGDCLQFVRYAQLVKQTGATVIIQAPKPLKPLLKLCPYFDNVIENIEELGHCDYYTSLMSLPAAFHINLWTIPHHIPYLFCDPHLIQKWEKNICKNAFNIGICWQADLKNDANRPPLARRSLSSHEFEVLSSIKNVKLYSLQKSEIAPAFMHDFGSELDNNFGAFMDTAAIITQLDLIISVDTSVAHLSGALGKPTWLILPFKADWRWLENDVYLSPWYPSFRLFRKSHIETWESVIKRIAQELQKLIDKKGYA